MAELEAVYNNGFIFIDAEILDETFTFFGAGFEVRVALHELRGHQGSSNSTLCVCI